MSNDTTRYIAFEGVTREEAKEWMHGMAVQCKMPEHLFMDGQSEEWKALFRATYPEGGMKDATPYNRWGIPPHHNAGAPRSNRKHEIRRMKTWTSTFRFYDLRDGWPMDPATPEQSHPEPDGA